MSKHSRQELLAEIGDLIRAAQVTTDRIDDAASLVMGINRTDHRAIDVITRRGSVTAGELARETGLSPAAMTSSLDRLEAAGYARRVPDEADRRRIRVEATEEVLSGAMELYGPMEQGFLAMVKGYSLKDLELILDWYRKGGKLGDEMVERMEKLAVQQKGRNRRSS
jgi:DNA-binding MarR family transcriptional regulator